MPERRASKALMTPALFSHRPPPDREKREVREWAHEAPRSCARSPPGPRRRPAHRTPDRRPRHGPGWRHAADGVRLHPLLGRAQEPGAGPARRQPGHPFSENGPHLPGGRHAGPAGPDRDDPYLPSSSGRQGGPRAGGRRPPHPRPHRPLSGPRALRLREPEYEKHTRLGLAPYGRLPARERTLEPTRPPREHRPPRIPAGPALRSGRKRFDQADPGPAPRRIFGHHGLPHPGTPQDDPLRPRHRHLEDLAQAAPGRPPRREGGPRPP